MKLNNEVNNAVIYCRYSPRPKRKKINEETREIIEIDENSNEKQEEKCKEYCLKNGYIINEIFKDCNVSGKIFRRKALLKVFKYLKRNPKTILIAANSSRLARDSTVAGVIRHKVEKYKCTIEYADGSPDYSTPESRLVQNMLAAVNQYERECLGRNTKRALQKKKANGEWLGTCPVGYAIDRRTRKLVVDDFEQDCMKFIIGLSTNNLMSSREIAGCVTLKKGLFRGKPWHHNLVWKIIKKSKKTEN